MGRRLQPAPPGRPEPPPPPPPPPQGRRVGGIIPVGMPYAIGNGDPELFIPAPAREVLRRACEYCGRPRRLLDRASTCSGCGAP